MAQGGWSSTTGELDIADSHFMADAYDTYADLRAKGPVSRLRFAAGEEESGDGEESREFFFRNETFFVTHQAMRRSRPCSTTASRPIPARGCRRSSWSSSPRCRRSCVRSPEHPLTRPTQPHAAAQTSPAKLHRTGHASVVGNIQQIADDFLDKAERDAAERGEATPDRRMDLIKTFAYPFPIVISDMLGIRGKIAKRSEDGKRTS